MKWLSPANITAFLVFSASAVLNYFGSSPKILYLPAFALCVWIMYQTHVYIASKEATTPRDRADSHVTTPTILAVPSPTPSPPIAVPKPKPIVSLSSSETDLRPSQITTKLAVASSFERDGIARALLGVSVDWTLLFSSANAVDADETITLAFFIDHDNEADLPTIVGCTLPTEGYKSLPLKNKTALFRVRGKISKAYMYNIDLKDASIELLHE